MSNTTQTKKNDEKTSNMDSCLGCSMIILGMMSVCGIIAAAICHVYLSIAGLAGVSNGDIRELCNSSVINATSDYTYIGEDPSEIWMYVLMSLLFVTGGLVNNTKTIASGDDGEKPLSPAEMACAMNCSAILYGGFCGWGYDQIWNSGTCLEHNFGNETLMISARIHFYMQASLCALIAFTDLVLIVSFLIAIMCDRCCNKDERESQTVAASDPDIRLRQVITGEGQVINSDKQEVYGVPSTDT